MPIRLPADAKEHEYEDLIAALLLTNGNYLETRLILKKESEEVLEFDAIATPCDDYHNRKVVEVKSGSWGVSDIFKLYGQTLYTGHNSAWLIHKAQIKPEKQSATNAVCEGLPHLKSPLATLNIMLDQPDSLALIPDAIKAPQAIRNATLASAWWSNAADRIALGRFRAWVKSVQPATAAVDRARTYSTSLGDSLFGATPLSRADAIYDAYKAAPQLTSSLISDAVSAKEDLKQVRRTVFDTNERPHIQYVAGLEHKARIAIVKNAYDALLAEKAGEAQTGSWKGESWDALYKAFLPESFKAGMIKLDAHAEPHRVAYFLQVFISVFGGFYFPQWKEDIDGLAAATGMPTNLIAASLQVLDDFFPIPNGWVHVGKGIVFLKGVPAYLRGIGCFMRSTLHGKDWSNKVPDASWMLGKWHNATYALLEPTHKVPQQPAAASATGTNPGTK